MNKTLILAAATAMILGGVGIYSANSAADAQDAPATMSDHPHPWGDHGHDGHGWGMAGKDGPGGWGMMGEHRHHHWMMAHKGWGLFYPVRDKNLSVTDVTTIAQAMLLRHGNHTWKVANVVQNQDNTVSFTYTTADGGVVARFAIDTQTGRVRRTG